MTSTSITRNSNLSSWFALAVGVVIVVSAGALYGRYSQRWGAPLELIAAGSHLDTMPSQLGPWQLVETMAMEESALTMLECAGYANRRYINQNTGQSVTLALIVGPPGPTAVHTPEICYSSRAYQLESKRKVISIDSIKGDSHSFWSVDFKTPDVIADHLRVSYAWNRGDHWEASEAPRYEFAAAPLLYKIQLAGQIEAGTMSEDRDPCRQFFEALVNSNWQLTAPTKRED